MRTIYEYLKTTYSEGQLAFFAVLGISLALGLVVSLTLALIFTFQKARRKKLSVETDIAETYLLYRHLCDEAAEAAKGEASADAREKLDTKINNCEQKLKDLLGDKYLSAAKRITEQNLKRQKQKIAKADERLAEKNEAKLAYVSPEANFLDDETKEEVMTVFADIDAPSARNYETENEEPPQEEISVKWKIAVRDGNYTAELFIGEDKILSSAAYGSLSGVKSAAITIKNNVLSGNAAVATENGKFLFKVFAVSGRVIAAGEKQDLKVLAEEAKALCERTIARASDKEFEIANENGK